MRPTEKDFAPFYKNYIDKVEGENVHELVGKYANQLNAFVEAIDEQKANYQYAPEKWTVKKVLLHIIDAERIFTYRALRFARFDATALNGFDEDEYALHSFAEQRTLASIKQEFLAVRKATDLLLLSFTDEQLKQKGLANNYTITVNALAFIIYGHALHHINVLKERYGV